MRWLPGCGPKHCPNLLTGNSTGPSCVANCQSSPYYRKLVLVRVCAASLFVVVLLLIGQEWFGSGPRAGLMHSIWGETGTSTAMKPGEGAMQGGPGEFLDRGDSDAQWLRKNIRSNGKRKLSEVGTPKGAGKTNHMGRNLGKWDELDPKQGGGGVGSRVTPEEETDADGTPVIPVNQNVATQGRDGRRITSSGKGAPVSPQPARIFDCFLFHSELDWLEIHLGELFDVVDVFVLVEAKQSHTGRPKPAVYEENKHRIPAKLRSKVFSVVIEDFDPLIGHMKDDIYLRFGDQWKRERAQRERLWTALIEAGIQPGDLVNLGDLDEIPHPMGLGAMRKGCVRFDGASTLESLELANQHQECGVFPVSLPLTNFVYNFWWENRNTYFSTQVFRYNGTNIRQVSRSSVGVKRVDNAREIFFAKELWGWHCSWCYSSLEDIHLKFLRNTHQELNERQNKDIQNIQNSICKGISMFRVAHRPWTFDRVQPRYLLAPKYVLDRRDQYSYLIPPVKMTVLKTGSGKVEIFTPNCTLPLRTENMPRYDPSEVDRQRPGTD